MTVTEPQHIISFSGGKDSTAMLLMMLDRGEPIHSVVFFDTGWEFPQMLAHVDRVEAEMREHGVPFWRLQSRFPFDYWLTARPVIARKGPMKGKVHRIGNGWPSPSRRWCTRQKTDTFDRYLRPIENAIACVGYAADESDRSFCREGITTRFPLQDWGVSEADALACCRDHGYDWGGLYDQFRRVSCFCCPLQGLDELRVLRHHYPDLWRRMLDTEDRMGPGAQRGFKNYTTVHDLDRRFADEDRQGRLAMDVRDPVAVSGMRD